MAECVSGPKLALQNPEILGSVLAPAHSDLHEHRCQRLAVVRHYCVMNVEDPSLEVILHWLNFSSTI